MISKCPSPGQTWKPLSQSLESITAQMSKNIPKLLLCSDTLFYYCQTDDTVFLIYVHLFQALDIREDVNTEKCIWSHCTTLYDNLCCVYTKYIFCLHKKATFKNVLQILVYCFYYDGYCDIKLGFVVILYSWHFNSTMSV